MAFEHYTAERISARGWRVDLPKRNGRPRRPCKLYAVWNNMHNRCAQPKRHDYKYYGARGIAVCTQWKDYSTFRIWAISTGFRKGLTLDRIDVNGNYEPSNCRWATRSHQQRNCRNNKLTTAIVREIRRSTHKPRYFERKYGIDHRRVYDIRRGTIWSDVQ